MKKIPSSKLRPEAYRHPIFWRLMALMFVLLSPILLLIDAAYADDDEDDRVWGDYWRDVMLVLSIALLPWEKRS